MQRRFEVIDVVVAVGVCTTILAGVMFFLAANGQLVVLPPGQSGIEQLTGERAGLHWSQQVPVRGIVDRALLDRRNGEVLFAAEARMKAVMDEITGRQQAPFGYLDSIKVAAARGQVDHAIRVQNVMGRSIVNSTSRGVRNHMLSEVRDGVPYNVRMIGVAAMQGREMRTHFLADWQPSLGRAILIAGQDEVRATMMRRERLGVAVIRLNTVRAAYEDSHTAILNRRMVWTVGGSSAIETGSLRHGRSVLSREAMANAQRGRPDFPMGTMVAASFVLVGLYATGLVVTSTMPAGKVDELIPFDPSTPVLVKAT